jgi:uncharacterized protein
MGYPVVHFEINSSAAAELAQFYGEAFDWRLEPDGPDYTQIHTEGVCAGSGAPGIDGGIGVSDAGDDFVTFYVQVPDVDEALGRIVALGAEIVTAPAEAGRVVFAIFRDPAGNRIGLVRAAPV